MKRKASPTNDQRNSKKQKTDQYECFNYYTPRRNAADDVYFDLTRLPSEILGNLIFKYFPFEYWLKSLALVSKQWHQAAIQANVDKQLRVNPAQYMYRYIAIASRYKVTTIVVEGPSIPKNQLSSLLKASPRLHTFVQFSEDYRGCNYNDMTFDFVKTACVAREMMDLFPKATRVQILSHLPVLNTTFPHIEELAISIPSSVNLNKFLAKFPSLKVLHTGIHFKEVPNNVELRVYSKSDKDFFKNYSYDQIWAGEHYKSPLLYSITQSPSNANDIKELAKHTSVQYEISLQDRINEYKFPAATSYPISIKRPKKTSLSAVANQVVMRDPWKALFYYKYFPAIDGVKMLLGRDEESNIEAFLIENALELSETMVPDLMKRLLVEFGFKKLHKIFTKEQLQRMISCKNDSGNILHHLMDSPDLLNDLAIEFGPLTTDWFTCEDINNETPVHRALSLKNMETIKFCVNAGVKIDARILFGVNPSDTARHENGDDSFVSFIQQVVKVIIEKNANSCTNINWFFGLHWCNLSENRTKKMLHFFVDLMKIEDLNEVKQEDINSKEFGTSLFNRMISGWDAEIDTLEYIVETYNIDINRADANNVTPLLRSIRGGLSGVMIWLLQKGANASPAKGFQPLYEVVKKKVAHPANVIFTIDALLEHGADINAYSDDSGLKMTPLLGAIRFDQPIEVIECLVVCGADPKMIDGRGNTTLHYARFHRSPEVIKYLRAFVDINKLNHEGFAPIHAAIMDPSCTSAVSTLLKYGADCNLPRSGLKMTPLLTACHQSNFEAIQELLKYNVKVQEVDVNGHSFVYYLVKYFQGYRTPILKEWFIENASHLLTPENTQFVINETKKIIEMSKTDAQISFNLFKLASSYLFVAEFLIEQVGFDINTQDHNGDVLLSYPMHRGEVQSYLLKQHPNVNIQNKDGNTPLMLAVQRNEDQWFCQALVDPGADPTLKNQWGVSALSILPNVATYFKERPIE